MKKIKKTKICDIRLDIVKNHEYVSIIVPRSCVLVNDDFPFIVQYIEEADDVTSLTMFLKDNIEYFVNSQIIRVVLLGPKKLLSKKRVEKELELKYNNQVVRIKQEKDYSVIGIRWDKGVYFSYFGF